jgi:radical SAM protein with 4Fe4S-binding SPASM domain
MPCPLLQIPLGNVKERSIREIWEESEEVRRIDAITWADLETCRDCDLVSWCMRCHGAALTEDGDMRGPSRVACAVARARRDALKAGGSGR